MAVENAILNINEEGHIESITCTIDGEFWSVPLKEDNRHYQLVLDAIIEQGADCWDGDIPEELQAAADAKQASDVSDTEPANTPVNVDDI